MYPQTTAITVVPFPALGKVLEPVDADLMCPNFCSASHPLLGDLYNFENDEGLEKKKQAMVAA